MICSIHLDVSFAAGVCSSCILTTLASNVNIQDTNWNEKKEKTDYGNSSFILKWKEKNEEEKKQTKNEKTDYCNPSFYRNKREKRQNENKELKQSEKQTKKASIILEKKNLLVQSGRKFCTLIGYEHVNWSQTKKKI